MSAKTEQPCWLIRDNRNVIRGPVSNSEVLQLLKKGHLKGKTEICRANTYWFGVDEKTEIAKFFPEIGGTKENTQPEHATQMTATLTEAMHSEAESKIDSTQFISPEQKSALPEDKKNDDSILSASDNVNEQMQWLSDEFADEFGSELADNVETMRIDKEGHPLDKRSSAKADALPSEMKGSVGERPKPISSLMKGPDKSGSAHNASHTVNVPIAATEANIKIMDPIKEAQEEARISRRNLQIFFMVVFLFLTAGSFLFYMKFEKKGVVKVAKNTTGVAAVNRAKLAPEESMRKAFLLYDLEASKDALSELEQASKGQAIFPLSQAIFKKEFLYDADSALSALQTAKSLSDSKELSQEIDNLIAIYTFERDKNGAINAFKKMMDDSAATSVFKYNLSMAYLRAGKWQEAGSTANALLSVVRGNTALSLNVNLVIGWAKELSGVSDAASEAAFSRAIELDPFSAKAHLGLAINKLRRKGLRESEAEFRAFLDTMPEIDGPDRVASFRQMNNYDVYNFARVQIRDLNVPGGSVGTKPSPMIMAVDAVLSCLQNRQGEAGKILEGALSSAPGDITILKAVGYHRWREGRYDEIVELLKDQAKERNGFAVNYLLAKAYEKTSKKTMEEKHIQALTEASSDHSESWSLLGKFRLRQGDSAGAKAAFQEALDRNPQDLEALRGLDRLGEDQLLVSSEFKDFLPF